MEKNKFLKFKMGKKMYNIKNYTHEDFNSSVPNNWKVIKNKSQKLILLNWAMTFFKTSKSYFVIESIQLPFEKKKIEIKSDVISMTSPYWYYELLTEHLNDDWYVSFDYESQNNIDLPKIKICLKDDLKQYKIYSVSIKREMKELLRIYLNKKYSCVFDSKSIKGKVILISRDTVLFSDSNGMYFNVYLLLNQNYLTYAFLELTDRKYLRPGVYDLYAKQFYLKGYNGFIIKKAKLKNELSSKKINKPFGSSNLEIDYKWGFKQYFIKYKTLFNGRINHLIYSNFNNFKNVILIILAILIFLGNLNDAWQLISNIDVFERLNKFMEW